jgi:hypothetical protein
MTTYPNQRVVHIHKKKGSPDQPFLQIRNDEWQRAARELTGAAFKLYIYLAANADGFDLALSKEDVMNCTGIKSDAYYDSFNLLVTKGYLVKVQGNIYNFYTYLEKPEEVIWKNQIDPLEKPETASGKTRNPIWKNQGEIHNIHNIYKTHMCNDDISPEGILVEKSTLTSKPTPSGDFQSQLNSWMRESRKNRT